MLLSSIPGILTGEIAPLAAKAAEKTAQATEKAAQATEKAAQATGKIAETVSQTAEAAENTKGFTDLNPGVGALIILIFVSIMISPALQINLSLAKNKYVWIILPVVMLALFTTLSVLFIKRLILQILFSICVPAILVIIHIAVKKNMIV